MIAPKLYVYQGRERTARELAAIAGCSVFAMKSRLKIHTADEAVALGSTRHVGVRGDALCPKTWSHRGQALTCAQLAALANCPDNTMRTRLRKRSPEDAVAMGPQRPQGPSRDRIDRHAWGGQQLTISELAQKAACSAQAMRSRLRRMKVEAAVALGSGGYRVYPYQGSERTAADLAKLAGVSRNKMVQRLEVYTAEQAVAMGPSPKRGVKAGTGGGRTPRQVQMGDRLYTVRELGELAGCNAITMYYRLRRHTPAEAVAMGAPNRHCPKMPRSVPPPSPALRVPRHAAAPAPAPTPAPKPAPVLRRVAPGLALERARTPPAPPPDADVIVPADVKRTVAEPKPDNRYTATAAPSTFGRIGQYLPDETHIARVYGGRK